MSTAWFEAPSTVTARRIARRLRPNLVVLVAWTLCLLVSLACWSAVIALLVG